MNKVKNTGHNNMHTWCLSVARLLVCIGDCGITPLEGGIPMRPHIMTFHKSKTTEIKSGGYCALKFPYNI